MKTAVLMIIGATVIGPIEGKWVDDETYRQCYDRQSAEIREKLDVGYWIGPGFPCDPLRGHVETIPELCARTMREVGSTYPGWSGQPPSIGAFVGFIGVPPYTDTSMVRCIPVPEGYRRAN